jgi:hypothetical protein
MNVERTVEFILDAQAKAEVRMAVHERRMAEVDKRLNGVTKLIQQGMRLLANSKKETDQKINALIASQLRTDEALKELAAAQKVTEKKMQTFLNRQTRNGH